MQKQFVGKLAAFHNLGVAGIAGCTLSYHLDSSWSIEHCTGHCFVANMAIITHFPTQNTLKSRSVAQQIGSFIFTIICNMIRNDCSDE